jgi:hypothetical protein
MLLLGLKYFFLKEHVFILIYDNYKNKQKKVD